LREGPQSIENVVGLKQGVVNFGRNGRLIRWLEIRGKVSWGFRCIDPFANVKVAVQLRETVDSLIDDCRIRDFVDVALFVRQLAMERAVCTNCPPEEAPAMREPWMSTSFQSCL
jgi:hypothetical protein